MLSRIRMSTPRAYAIAMLVFVVLAFGATAASAAPQEPWMGVVQLQQVIDSNGGSVDGHMLTVLKGSTIESIPVRILAVTGGMATGPSDLSALILFEAQGGAIEEIGGIASGMSGSPVYVDAGAPGVSEDTLVGALSYGDWFTLNGTGLATPIEAMSTIERGYGALSYGIRELPRPIAIDGQIKSSVVIAPNPAKLKAASEDGAVVARPLSALYVGGLTPKSPVYQAYRRHLEANGGSLVPLETGLSSMVSSYDEAFSAGSGIAALMARGDLWVGGVGTVTYVNNGKVLAFGHPMNHDGKSGLYMTNAWIDGVWPSSNTPYKLGRPAAMRGTITQDRSAGIMGIEGAPTPETTITATVLNQDTGKTGTSTVGIPRFVINSTMYPGLAPMAAYVAATRVFDQATTRGSAVTTTTVLVSDGTTVHEIERVNIVDDGLDIPSAAMMDVADIVGELQYVGENGLAHPDILAVDIAAEITTARNTAAIFDVTVNGGLRTRANMATVSLFEFGNPTAQTVDVPFTIPAGVPLTGRLTASGPGGFMTDGASFEQDTYFEQPTPVVVDRRTVAEAVTDLANELPNNSIVISYKPLDMASETDQEVAAPQNYDPIEVDAEVDWFVTGGSVKSAPQIRLAPSSASINYGGRVNVTGGLVGVYETSEVDVSLLFAGSGTPTPIETVSVNPLSGSFDFYSPRLLKNGRLIFTYPGSPTMLPTTATLNVKVRAATSLKSSSYSFRKGKTVRLTGSVAPSTATGAIVFERYSGGWRTIGSKKISGGKATLSYKPRKAGTYKLRARYVSATGSTNIGSKSASKTLRVR